MSITCRHYRALLPGYIQRELTPKQRAQVSRHLNECDDCYAAYVDQRQLVRELRVSVPRIGTRDGETPAFDAIRAAVLAQVSPAALPAAPPATTPTAPIGRRMRVDLARYGLVAILMLVVLLLPLSMRSPTFSVPTQPTPDKIIAQGTAVAALPAEPATLTATLQPNYAPRLGATDTP